MTISEGYAIGFNCYSIWKVVANGLIVYRRGLDPITGQYLFDYSNDGGVTWQNLRIEDSTEDTILQDKTFLYRHRIVGTQYRIDQTLTPTGYAGVEDVDWINLYST